MADFEKSLQDLDVDAFWTEGYAILPDVYTEEEVAQMRDEVMANATVGGELTAGPLKHVLTDGKMAAVAKKLLDTDDVIYGGGSSATINGKIRVWHKDNTDRLDEKAPDWDDRYTQLRFGIYLQDHTEHSGGLNLKPGAHDICDLSSGKTTYVRSRPTDLLVWSMRMTHSGAGTLLKDPDRPDPEPKEWDSFSEEEVAPLHENRLAVFAHIGANDKHARRYLDYLRHRTYIANMWRNHPFTPETIAELEAAGLTVRNMPAEVIDDPRAGGWKEWQPYWYPGKADPEPQIVYREKVVEVPAAAPAAAKPAASQAFVPRYSRAVKRRLSGVTEGAVNGWHGAAPKGARVG
ncbi:hypothetical protein [Branchiibius sp. NY16-3462-2]|uniref:hypothetical protein n=1 Tax=Branchiibius sp. NY16-3462-2 TaxID=1807500 RepID=UPI0007964B43|nr:hypothetical protein [Branchiibius sp. NY16-3462-2]KYH45619.1 hypothetical protein AZH51_18030 [Branchiibius sp. NY16-3462-2]